MPGSPRAGVGEDLRQAGDEVLERAAGRPPFDLGLEDVDAGLCEPPHVRHLGLELDALGVLGAQILDRPGLEVGHVGGVEDVCAPVVCFGHPCLMVLRSRSASSGSRFRPRVWRPSALFFGSTPRGSERRIRIGAVAVGATEADLEVQVRRGRVAGHAGEAEDLALGDGAGPTHVLREVRVVVGVAVVGGEVGGVPAGPLVRHEGDGCRPSPPPRACPSARTCRCPDGRSGRRSRRCRRRPAPGTRTGPPPGWQ